MKALIETLHNIALGLFVNGSYGIMQGDIDTANITIIITTIIAMYGFNRLKRGYDGR